MPLVVVGTIAFDTIKTPAGRVDDVLGGSATHFALASAILTPTRLVGVVGEDFPEEHFDLFQTRGIDTEGVQKVAGARTFRWSGEYFEDMNQRETLSVELNVIEDYRPTLTPAQRASRFVFLANGHPETQASVLDQVSDEAFVMADTMDLWIQTAREALESLLRRLDGLVLNDQEAFLLADDRNLVRAGRKIRDYGLRYVVIKKGEHGCLIFLENDEIYLPALPIAEVVDPTGAGDSFAGGLMGHLAEAGSSDAATFKRAAAWGTVLASLCCEDYDVRRMRDLERPEADRRFRRYCEMLCFD